MVNGAYGRRIVQIASVLEIDTAPLSYPEDSVPCPQESADALASDGSITHVAVVHCKTTTGIINPIQEIGTDGNRFRERFLVTVGGGPVTQEEGNEIGADGYGSSTIHAVKTAKRLMLRKGQV